MQDPDRLFTELVVESGREWDDDNPFAPGPRPRPLRERMAALGVEALPVLERELRSERPRRRAEAARVLELLAEGDFGERARGAICAAAPEHPEELGMPCLRVDAERMVARSLHLHPKLASHVLGHASRLEPELVARVLEEAFDDPVATAALLHPRFNSAAVDRIVMPWPEVMPAGRLVQLEEADDESVGATARRVLERLARPEDRARLLAKRQRLTSYAAVLFGSHPASTSLFSMVVKVDDSLVELVLRRTCAGLGVPEARVMSLLRRLLRGRALPYNLQRGYRIASILGWQAEQESFTAKLHARRHSRLRPELRDIRPNAADDCFRSGLIEAATMLPSAFLRYAGELVVTGSPGAAFQLAWIDRAFGAPPDAERIEWLRGLGFADEELLAELGRPPPSLGGPRRAWRPLGEAARHRTVLAGRAEDAGLFGLAAQLFEDPTDVSRCQGRCEAHLARVRA